MDVSRLMPCMVAAWAGTRPIASCLLCLALDLSTSVFIMAAAVPPETSTVVLSGRGADACFGMFASSTILREIYPLSHCRDMCGAIRLRMQCTLMLLCVCRIRDMLLCCRLVVGFMVMVLPCGFSGWGVSIGGCGGMDFRILGLLSCVLGLSCVSPTVLYFLS